MSDPAHIQIKDETRTSTLFIVQYRERHVEEREYHWFEIGDIHIKRNNMLPSGIEQKPYRCEFNTLEQALEAIDLSKHIRAFHVWENERRNDETALDVVERRWEYRVIKRTVTTRVEIELAFRENE